jgi:hypothetical protein
MTASIGRAEVLLYCEPSLDNKTLVDRSAPWIGVLIDASIGEHHICEFYDQAAAR